jgi:hypothetical protein
VKRSSSLVQVKKRYTLAIDFDKPLQVVLIKVVPHSVKELRVVGSPWQSKELECEEQRVEVLALWLEGSLFSQNVEYQLVFLLIEIKYFICDFLLELICQLLPWL